MVDARIAGLQTELPTGNLRLENSPDNLTVNTLGLAAFRQSMSANYINILTKKVFDKTSIFGKEGVKFRKILSSEEANTVLNIIWKESNYVSEHNVIMAGYDKKTFSGVVNCYSLDVSLASSKIDVAATVTRVRNIVIAGCAYKLLTRNQINPKNTPIRCESLLNDIMLELGSLNEEAGQYFSIRVDWEISHLRQRSAAFYNRRS